MKKYPKCKKSISTKDGYINALLNCSFWACSLKISTVSKNYNNGPIV